MTNSDTKPAHFLGFAQSMHKVLKVLKMSSQMDKYNFKMFTRSVQFGPEIILLDQPLLLRKTHEKIRKEARRCRERGMKDSGNIQ